MAEVSANGLRHHVQRLGGGSQTVVFLHGLVVDNLSGYYFTLANPVAQMADVILYDLRGHGMSERSPSGYRIDDFVADLEGILIALDVHHPVSLVGNSFGGVLALSYAHRNPDRVRGVAVVDGHFPLPGWGTEMASTLELEGEQRDLKIAELYKDWHAKDISRKRRRLVKNAEFLVYESTLLADLRASAALSESQLASISTPVLGLYGEHSELVARAREVAKLLPNFDLHLLPHCSHQAMFEAPELVRQHVLVWLEGLEGLEGLKRLEGQSC
ncbi:MAG: hypothetical protein A2289_05520 [Deltaproteobacteria bacterium RIFOXYA12_FULL_58_15]|nr:MAG: hypothetical protein A2289_05520 [Deltaproteobacteria bacterium RIFOXYA12_FULL_58_15]